MNSPVEEIFSFKACCGIRPYDQNLEILLKNMGDRAVVVPSYFVLRGKWGSKRIEPLMPYGDLRIEPGDIKAFYCSMDETQWDAAEELVFYDREDNEYAVELGVRIED